MVSKSYHTRNNSSDLAFDYTEKKIELIEILLENGRIRIFILIY